MLLVKTPNIVKKLFPKLVWDVPTTNKEVYLTFDDGPTPEITNWVLAQLQQFNAKGTFFCIGKNIHENPEIFARLLQEGHSVGNHTNNHHNAWKVGYKCYIKNTLRAEEEIIDNYPAFKEKKLFRPPYGKFTPKIVNHLKQQQYTIVGWDIISEDYDATLSIEKVYNNVINHVQPGSIIVFHDSVKAFKNLKEVLPRVLTYLSDNGYTFKAL
ncbi:polysaccharide deacetylase family protein [Neptunitalea lumnitzerae]|uniref:Polysaccharide deacetylase n=1 Tax=Neptunitalea lumnitzerae TaxID=2965509 RepID=A0ABQ5MMT3_9FLAO|nr:polysaccharide deacetylase family protein [Neptunitalea sp. Y10]GLB50701.1 polysaccharide deacetylase [Neptunitalea sp. Y10]